MSLQRLIAICAFGAAAAAGGMAAAQEPPSPLILSVEGLYSSQGNADLDGGGEFSVDRTFLRASGLYRFGNGTVAGLSVSRGWLDYSFGGGAAVPWDDVNDIRVSVPLRFSVSPMVNVFVAPGLRYDYESGADSEDGRTYGAFFGATWQLNERLALGPAFGVYTQIEDDDPNIFPAILIDWSITDRLNLSTAPTIGATQGPGLSLTYDVGRDVSVGLAGRYEDVRFRLNDRGPAPGGVGQDRSFPLVVTFGYNPNPGIGVAAFAGAEFGGRLRLEDANGVVVDERDFDPAPVVGAAFRLAF